jgi:hypothetical protein
MSHATASLFRDSSEIGTLHGNDGRLEAVTLRTGERLPFSFLFFFLGARPCTEWLDDAVARDEDGFILTGALQAPTTCSRPACQASSLLATYVPARPSAAPPLWAKDQWPCSWYTLASPVRVNVEHR